MEDKIILLILKIFTKIVSIIEIIVKKTTSENSIYTGICISYPENSYRPIRDKGLLTLGRVIDKDYTEKIIVIMTSLIEPIKIMYPERKG